MTTLRKFAGFVPPEKNYFHMPNEWIDICAEIDNLAEIKVIQYVLRHTWGYQEYGIAKAITVDEFMYGRKRTDGTRMDKGTGLKSDRSVKDGIKDAIEHGYLICEIDATDKARIVKSYALRTASNIRQVDTTPQIRGVDTTPLTGRYYPPEGYNLPLDQVDTTPRSEKDTIERHYKKDTIERHEREVAHATARSHSSSQNDLSEETEKREAVKPSQKEVTDGNTLEHTSMGGRTLPANNRRNDVLSPSEASGDTHRIAPPQRKEHTNAITHPPAPRKPPTNPVPRRPKQQGLMDELPSSPASKPVEPHAEMTWGTRKCLQWFDYWRGGVLIAKYKLQQAASCAKGLAEQFDEATVIQIRGDMADDPYYIERGGPDICDVANNIHKYLNKKKPKKEPSNEHKVASQYSPKALYEKNKWKADAMIAAYEAKEAAKQGVQS